MTAQDALTRASELFHQIVGNYSARQILSRLGGPVPNGMTPAEVKLRDDLLPKLLTDEQIEQLAADGFELCVRGLVALGDPSASIHECRAKDIEEP